MALGLGTGSFSGGTMSFVDLWDGGWGKVHNFGELRAEDETHGEAGGKEALCVRVREQVQGAGAEHGGGDASSRVSARTASVQAARRMAVGAVASGKTAMAYLARVVAVSAPVERMRAVQRHWMEIQGGPGREKSGEEWEGTAEKDGEDIVSRVSAARPPPFACSIPENKIRCGHLHVPMVMTMTCSSGWIPKMGYGMCSAGHAGEPGINDGDGAATWSVSVNTCWDFPLPAHPNWYTDTHPILFGCGNAPNTRFEPPFTIVHDPASSTPVLYGTIDALRIRSTSATSPCDCSQDPPTLCYVLAPNGHAARMFTLRIQSSHVLMCSTPLISPDAKTPGATALFPQRMIPKPVRTYHAPSIMKAVQAACPECVVRPLMCLSTRLPSFAKIAISLPVYCPFRLSS
ncbi:hypothetical protein B0H21DRAFT_865010 [Amylocystis lapponica]|nr:hypothetical protein B0H21DRAFT_865010 [Amylocystis lapponica]